MLCETIYERNKIIQNMYDARIKDANACAMDYLQDLTGPSHRITYVPANFCI